MSATKRFLEELGDICRPTVIIPEPTGGICYEKKTEPTCRWIYLDQLIREVDKKINSLDEHDANGHSMWNEFKVFLLQQTQWYLDHDFLARAIINRWEIPYKDQEQFTDFVKRKYNSGFSDPRKVVEHWNNYKAKMK